MSGQASQWLAFGEKIWTQVCFHSQQCVEKSLKAVLVHSNVTVPKTHSIADLKSLMPQYLLVDVEDDISVFDDFYIPVRYPDMLPGGKPDGLPDKSDASEVLSLATTVFRQIESYLDQEIGSEKLQAS